MIEKYEDIWKMRDMLEAMQDPHIVSGAELERLRAASNDADRLRDGIQRVIDGTYGREKHFKTKHDTCPHGQFSWQSCDPCVDEYLASLIA